MEHQTQAGGNGGNEKISEGNKESVIGAYMKNEEMEQGR